MWHTVSVLVENKFGVLTRVAGLFSGRGYNIHSLNVAPTHDATLSRMTIVTQGNEETIEQIIKQLNKLVEVVKVDVFACDEDHIERELVLIRVKTSSTTRTDILQTAQIFRAKIVDVQLDTLTLELTGQASKIEKFIELMESFEIVSINRTGRIAMSRE
ncbi:MAG: acetolactate synthase small subunit [Verrucomicrobiae bacterium]|nr:acetolactate synthase small subunit [Verrucomicrobiae bacterium]